MDTPMADSFATINAPGPMWMGRLAGQLRFDQLATLQRHISEPACVSWCACEEATMTSKVPPTGHVERWQSLMG